MPAQKLPLVMKIHRLTEILINFSHDVDQPIYEIAWLQIAKTNTIVDEHAQRFVSLTL